MSQPRRRRDVPAAFLMCFAMLSAEAQAGGAAAEAQPAKRGPRLRLDGYGQLDGRFLLGWQAHEGVEPREEAQLDVARLRVGLVADWGAVSSEVQADVVDEDVLKDAWLGVRLARALRLRLGHQKLPLSAEWMTSARRIEFVKRSLPVESLAPGRDWGFELHGELSRFEYEAGVFAGDGWKSKSRAGTTAVGRLLFEPVKGLRVGGSASLGRVHAAPVVDGVAGEPRGLDARSPSGFTYFERKYVDGTRWRAGAEAGGVLGRVSLAGEYVQQQDERVGQGPLGEDLPAVVGRGWTGSVVWLVAGERRKSRVHATRRFPGGPGAFEAAARVEALRWQDAGAEGFSGVGSRSRHLRPAADQVFTGGLSWWPADPVRLMANAVVERFEDPLIAPDPGRRTYTTLLVRLQLELP